MKPSISYTCDIRETYCLDKANDIMENITQYVYSITPLVIEKIFNIFVLDCQGILYKAEE